MYGDHFSSMGIGMLFFWIVFIVIIVAIVKAVTTNGTQRPSKESPMEILKSRYARGDIDDKEFQHRKSELENKHREK